MLVPILMVAELGRPPVRRTKDMIGFLSGHRRLPLLTYLDNQCFLLFI